MMPTIEQVMKCYRVVAQSERMKTGRPGEGTVANALRGTRCVCRAAGIDLASPVTALTRQAFATALSTFVEHGLSRLTAWSYVCQLRAVFARWSQPYYKAAGWEIPALDIPSFRAKAPRYVRPGAELLARVKAWYGKQTGEYWFAATMMLEFAVRNGDVKRLGRGNFVDVKGRVFLNYTPNKTSHSSGRVVKWPVHPEIWATLERLRPWDRAMTDAPFNRVNKAMRELGFRGTKGAYELRKLCIDHVYQRFGAEMAVSISGDDIKTITRYYADPSQPNIGDLRVSELL